MDARNIKKHLRDKFADWVFSIEDSDLRDRVAHQAYMTGGCVASLLLGEKPHDYDIYIRSYGVALDLAKYYAEKFCETSHLQYIEDYTPIDEDGNWKGEYLEKGGVTVVGFPSKESVTSGRVKIYIKSSGASVEGDANNNYQFFEMMPDETTIDWVSRLIEAKKEKQVAEHVGDIIEKEDEIRDKIPDEQLKKYRPVFLTSNAISLSDGVQVIVRFVGTPREVHRNFDFVHCINYFTPWDNKLHLNRKALTSLLTKELVYMGSKYPVCSLFRLRKFLGRGFHIHAGQIVKMAFQVSELNLHDYDVLEEQLTGVDVAYFMDVIERLRSDDHEKVNAAYLLQIMDEIAEDV